MQCRFEVESYYYFLTFHENPQGRQTEMLHSSCLQDEQHTINLTNHYYNLIKSIVDHDTLHVTNHIVIGFKEKTLQDLQHNFFWQTKKLVSKIR